MKKLFAIIALLAISASAAHADSVTVEAAHINGKSNSVTVVPSFNVSGLTLDARLKASRSLNDRSSNELELRVGKSFAVTEALSASVRVGAGKSFGTDVVTYRGTTVLPGKVTYAVHEVQVPVDYGFYSVEPGVKYALNDTVALKLSDRYIHTFNGQDKYVNGHEFGVAAEYAVTKTSVVGVKYVHQHGTSNGNGVKLAYSRLF